MKLTYAGPNYFGEATPFLFNCKRNPRCQKKYFIPITGVHDLMLYLDLPGKPTSYWATIVDRCQKVCEDTGGDFSDDFGDDFDTGGGYCWNPEISLLFEKYTIGQTPQGNWYSVFKDAYTTEQLPKCFYIKFIIEADGIIHTYFSQEICVEDCAPLCLLKGCYPNEPIGSDAFDCNGIYYGFHAGEEEPLGFANYRYFHWAYVRNCSITDENAKLSFTYFNNKRNYKTRMVKEKMLEFELVPAFYKDVILGIFARGNIRVNDYEYRLSEEQSWTVRDRDSKLWQLDTLLFDDCNSIFGCAPADCKLPPEDCHNNYELGEWSIDPETSMFIQEFIGDFNSGDVIEWELYIDGDLFTAGNILEPPLSFSLEEVDPTRQCITIKWRVKCWHGEFSDWKESTFGKCDEELALQGSVAMFSYGGGFEGSPQQCSAQGVTKLRFRFAAPTPAQIDLLLAAVYTFNNWTTGNGIGGDMLPPGHPDKTLATPSPAYGPPISISIPAGTTDWTSPILQHAMPGFPGVMIGINSYPQCNGSFGNTYTAKIYFKVVAPSGTLLNLPIANDTPAPWNPRPNAFTMTQIP